MPYTTQGYMTHEDIRDWEESTDNGTVTVYLDNPPVWFVEPIRCPVCGDPTRDHGSVSVGRASGEIEACDY